MRNVTVSDIIGFKQIICLLVERKKNLSGRKIFKVITVFKKVNEANDLTYAKTKKRKLL